MKTLPLAMVFAALTQYQSGIVMSCLVFVTILLCIGGFKMWRRLTDLESIVYSTNKVTKEAKKIMREIESISEDSMG